MKFFGNAATMPTQTNADRIRAMSDEELAGVLSTACLGCPVKECRLHNYASYGCKNKFLQWLKQPAEAVADYLLDCGVIVLPCKIGDTLYVIEPRIYNYKMHEGVQTGVCEKHELNGQWGNTVWVRLDDGEPHTLYAYNFSSFGKTVFLNREEAENALLPKQETVFTPGGWPTSEKED